MDVDVHEMCLDMSEEGPFFFSFFNLFGAIWPEFV